MRARIVMTVSRHFGNALPSQVLAQDAGVLRMLDVLRLAGELDPADKTVDGGEW